MGLREARRKGIGEENVNGSRKMRRKLEGEVKSKMGEISEYDGIDSGGREKLMMLQS